MRGWVGEGRVGDGRWGVGEGDGADSRHMREDRRVRYAAGRVFSDIRKFSSTPETTSHPSHASIHPSHARIHCQGGLFALLIQKKERRRNSKRVRKPELEFFEPGGPVWWTDDI